MKERENLTYFVLIAIRAKFPVKGFFVLKVTYGVTFLNKFSLYVVRIYLSSLYYEACMCCSKGHLVRNTLQRTLTSYDSRLVAFQLNDRIA